MLTTIKTGFCLLGCNNLVWKARNFSSISTGKYSSALEKYSSTKLNVRNLYTTIPELPLKVENISEELIMDWVHPRDADEIREYLLQHFFTATPVRELYCMDHNPDEARRSPWLKNLVRDYASQPYSVLVHKKTNINGDPRQIVAVSLNMLELKPSQQPIRIVPDDEPFDQSFGWSRRALKKELNREVDLFDRYQTDKVLNLGMASIRPDLGRLGILTTMTNVAIDRAYRDYGVEVIKADVASTFAQRILNKMACEIIRTVNLAEFECPVGVKPFANLKEMLQKHPSFQLVAKKLPL